MLLYKRFFKRFGVRLAQHLAAPKINDNINLRMPRDSVFHYLPEDSVHVATPHDHWSVKDAERLVMMEHVEELSSDANEGGPRKTPAISSVIARDYHRKNRKVKLVRNLETNTKEPRTILIVNYAILPQLYRYTKSFFSDFYRWKNIASTLVDKINQLDNQIDRQHFIYHEIPTPLPSLALLKRAENNLSRSVLDELNTPEGLFALEVWKWLGPKRETSVFYKLNEKTIPKVNLIFKWDNRWILLNLGVIEDLRKGAESDGEFNPEILQKRFLRMLMTLFESTTSTTDMDDEDILEELEEESDSEDYNDEEDDILEDIVTSTPKQKAKEALKEIPDEQLEEELNAINEVTKNRKVKEEKARKEESIFDLEIPELNYAILDKAEGLAQDGVISAAEYKRFSKLADKYKELPNPYTGKGNLLEDFKVSPEDIKLEEPTSYPDSPMVLDKSMNESMVEKFDKEYIKKVLPKDIVNSVVSINRAGVAVSSYEIEVKEDIANKYEMHSIKLVPVNGKPSTIHLKIPVIDEDGTFTANGVRYRARKQRGDLPIRKVKPNKVALTSYYGKIFVSRSDKVVHDYAKWLTNNVRTMGLDTEDPTVSELKMSRANLTKESLPRLYSILGSEFKTFNVKEYKFFLDYHKRKEYFGEESIESVEKNGLVVLGHKLNNKKLMLGVDTNDTLYLVQVDSDDIKVVGTIEDLIELDKEKAPIDIVEVGVFAKKVPVGIMLAYYAGLNTLLSNLPGTVRRVPQGERLHLNNDEYAIRFRDETLVVTRDDALTSMILGSFNGYKKSIKNYDIEDFNDKDVYFNVLDENGLGIRYIKEMDLLSSMFIDPITLEILEELKEPTTWIGLLKRSVELLTTDYSPSEVDMASMRIKGYERIAGAVYSELVNSVRVYSAREGSPNASIELKPFAVWQAINSDQSVTLVEESNPIRNLKEKEAVTYVGAGGRGKTSMVGRTRVFEKADMGVISEATVDSGDVAINTALSPNPKFKSLRGLTLAHESGKDGNSSLLSTSALLSPAATFDD